MKQGVWKGGEWVSTGYVPAKNNPKGHNQHTKKELLVKSQPKPLTEVESFNLKQEIEKKAIIKQLGYDIWKLGCELAEMKRRFTIYNKEYFGWRFKE